MSKTDSHSENTLASSRLLRRDTRLDPKEQERLERKQRIQENTKNFQRHDLKPVTVAPDERAQQLAREMEEDTRKHDRLHDKHMAELFEQFSTFHRQSVEDFEDYKAKVREELESGSKSSGKEKSSFWNYGAVIPQSDSPDRKKDLDLFEQSDDQRSHASKQRNKGQQVGDGLESSYEQPYKDDFNVEYRPPKSQGLEVLNRQLIGSERKDLPQKTISVLHRVGQIFTTNTERINLEELPTPVRKLAKELIKYGNDGLNGREVPIDRYNTAIRELEGILKTIENMQRATKQEIFIEMDEKLKEADEKRSKREDNKGKRMDNKQSSNVGDEPSGKVFEVQQRRSSNPDEIVKAALKTPEKKENHSKT